MSVTVVLIIVGVGVLVAAWLVQAYREPPPRRRPSQNYQNQHTENPAYFPGHGGGAQIG